MSFKVPLLRLGIETVDRRTLVPEGQFTLHPDGAPVYRVVEGTFTQPIGEITSLHTHGDTVFAAVKINSNYAQVGHALRNGEEVLLADMTHVDFNVREGINMLVLKGVVRAALVDSPLRWPWKD